MAASKLILLLGEGATSLMDESSKSAPQTAVLLKKCCLTDFASALLGGEIRATPLEDESSKSAPQTAVLLKKCFLTDFASALLDGEIGATSLEEFDESEKSAVQTAVEVLLQNDDRTDR
ncbi:hypothetical protein PS2_044792 [Malus domestica]